MTNKIYFVLFLIILIVIAIFSYYLISKNKKKLVKIYDTYALFALNFDNYTFPKYVPSNLGTEFYLVPIENKLDNFYPQSQWLHSAQKYFAHSQDDKLLSIGNDYTFRWTEKNFAQNLLYFAQNPNNGFWVIVCPNLSYPIFSGPREFRQYKEPLDVEPDATKYKPFFYIIADFDINEARWTIE